MIHENLLRTIEEKDRQLWKNDKMLALLLSEVHDSREESKCLLGSIYSHIVDSDSVVLGVTMTRWITNSNGLVLHIILKFIMDTKWAL